MIVHSFNTALRKLMQDNFKFNVIIGYLARTYVKVCLQHVLIAIDILNILWDRIQSKKNIIFGFKREQGIKGILFVYAQ